MTTTMYRPSQFGPSNPAFSLWCSGWLAWGLGHQLGITGLHFLLMGGLNLLLICGNAYMTFPSSLLWLILGKAQLDGILVTIDFSCTVRRHANVDRDDSFYPISQWEWSFTYWDALGSPVAHRTPVSFSSHLPFTLSRLLDSLLRIVWLLISAWPLPYG